jgi:hypothetical protein
MFFRREKVKTPTFADRMENLKKSGMAVSSQAGGFTRVSKGDFAVDLTDRSGLAVVEHHAGIRMGSEIGSLVDGGYQKWFQTPGGKKKPALAEELKGLHDFEEDIKEGLGQESLYNEGLGTVSTYYLYDRVADRDKGVPKRAWEQ